LFPQTDKISSPYIPELRAAVGAKRFPFPQMKSIPFQFGADSIRKANHL
jgi:hypothetical protein